MRNPTVGVQEHLDEALKYFKQEQIIGIFLQGSQNYSLECESSDIDTKLIVAPSFEDMALMRKPISTTHVRENNEHIDFKDVRLYLNEFTKQNINFVEILFTPYLWINPLYEEQWNRLVKNREAIAHMNPFRAVKSMQGMAKEKYQALEHWYDSKADILNKFGYDPKQLCHIGRLDDFIGRYIAGESFEDCLIPNTKGHIMDMKEGKFSLEKARDLALTHISSINETADKFCFENKPKEDPAVKMLLDNVQIEIMRTALKETL